MPGTTPKLALRYPLATEAPDGPGAFLALATDVEKVLGGAGWFPALGGTGAAIGANAAADGSYFQSGKHVSAKGRIAFGSTASFGTGTATISGLPGTIDTAHSTGYGHYIPTSGALIPVFFTAADGANMVIRPVISAASGSVSTLGVGFNLGTPAQSSQLIFTLDLLLV